MIKGCLHEANRNKQRARVRQNQPIQTKKRQSPHQLEFECEFQKVANQSIGGYTMYTPYNGRKTDFQVIQIPMLFANLIRLFVYFDIFFIHFDGARAHARVAVHSLVLRFTSIPFHSECIISHSLSASLQ